MTTAADLLRQALADAPDGLHVAKYRYGQACIFDGNGIYADSSWPREQATARLIGLLLAAAPHLADALDSSRPPCTPRDCGHSACETQRAIAEAAKAMEVRP